MNKTQKDFIKRETINGVLKDTDVANSISTSSSLSLSSKLNRKPNPLYDKVIRKHLLWIVDFYKTHKKQRNKPLDYELEMELQGLARTVENIQRHQSNRDYTGSFINIADAYDQCSAIDKSRSDYTWNLALEILNNEALNSASDKDGKTDAYKYSQVIYQKAIHELRRMKYANDIESIKNYAKSSIKAFYEYFEHVDKDNIFNWQRNEAMKLLHVATIYGRINNLELSEIESRVANDNKLDINATKFHDIQNEVHDYILLEDNTDNLKRMID